jgi:hypothetical protein
LRSKKHDIFYKIKSTRFGHDDTGGDGDLVKVQDLSRSYTSDSSLSLVEVSSIKGPQQDAEIYEYCPKIFKEIRELDGVSPNLLAEYSN